MLDQHLGRLAAYLRLLGMDCVHRALFPDGEVARVSEEEHRVLPSRDKRLLMRRVIPIPRRPTVGVRGPSTNLPEPWPTAALIEPIMALPL